MFLNNITTPILTNETIHIWQASVSKFSASIPCLLSVLDQDERLRAGRFIYEKHCNNFIIARALLRHLLAAYLKCLPQDLSFQQNKYGKLSLAKPANILSLQFNLSHAKDMVIYAFVLHRQIGIDIEYIRDDISVAEIAQRFFAKQEQEDILSLPKEQQAQVFFNCWTRKEAFIKALGKGLSYSLENFAVDVATKQNTTKINLVLNDNTLQQTNWSLFSLDTKPQYCSAVVVEGDCDKTQVFNYSTLLSNSYIEKYIK